MVEPTVDVDVGFTAVSEKTISSMQMEMMKMMRAPLTATKSDDERYRDRG